MTIQEPYPDLDELLVDIGKAGHRLSQIDASEGSAGNISVYAGWHIEPRHHFPKVEELSLPVTAPELAGACFVVSGSGCRLRDILSDPTANLGVAIVNPGGETAMLYTRYRCAFERVTSEFNSHFAVHRDRIRLTGTDFHAIVHAQPMHITYLSHIALYRDPNYLNRHLLRWQPELIVNLPQGLGVVPFLVPGSDALMAATLEQLRDHRVVVWSKHGVIAGSEEATLRASDRIEYVETAARYEYLNLCAGGNAEGLSPEEIRTIAAAFGVEQNLF
ncbi:MAG: class II aldolase/adducin family protein [Anaerolineae bacterium]|nr:class II aldolase/adducin family protein [Anaerolineae bacterium]